VNFTFVPPTQKFNAREPRVADMKAEAEKFYCFEGKSGAIAKEYRT